MKIVSVNVGLPCEVEWHGRRVRTSIWKTPVEGRVAVRGDNLEGDRQSDLSVHGGPDKAVYVYAHEHYDAWRRECPDLSFPRGAFGENLTIEGLLEDEARIGDQLEVGSAEFRVAQPRMPCYKLGVRFDRDDMVKRFLESGRSGFYLAVVKEGEVGAGDAVSFTVRGEPGVTVADVAALLAHDENDPAALRRAIAATALPESLRSHFQQNLRRSPRG